MDTFVVIFILIGVIADTALIAMLMRKLHNTKESSIHQDVPDGIVADDARKKAAASLSDDEAESGKEDAGKVSEETRMAFIKALDEIGCGYERVGESSIHTRWQGENFTVDFGARFAMVWDPMWYAVNNRSDDFDIVLRAVNRANFNFGPVIVITAPDDKGMCGLCSRREMLVDAARKDNADYLQALFSSFFEAKDTFRKFYLQEKSKVDPAILN